MVDYSGAAAGAYMPQASAGPSSMVELHISCRNLVDLDTFSKSDPVVHVYIKDSKTRPYMLVGKTEVIDNNLNPDFTKHFKIDFYFEKEQWLKFDVYDVDVGGQDHIGFCETTLSRIMSAPRQTHISDLHLPNGGDKSRGKIIVRADSVAQSNDEVTFRVSATLAA